MAAKYIPLTGAESAAYAMKQINPDVLAAYPITPQTPIVMKFSEYVANGEVDTVSITVESEHSAMSATVGAAAAGARAMTATAANGLALMWEIVYIAASTRLPIVMGIVNRALSGPINIHGDHSDTMGARDAGWIQVYSENNQEVYDNYFMALRIAENEDVLLPVMVCQDGFITSHSVENVMPAPDQVVKEFIGKKKFKGLLTAEKPFTIGPLDLQDYYFEHKKQQHEAMKKVFPVIEAIQKEFAEKFGRKYDVIEEYRTEDADIVIMGMSSVMGTVKEVIDAAREKGIKVGAVKPRFFRPFPGEYLKKILSKFKAVGILDRSDSFGSLPPLFTETAAVFYTSSTKPLVKSYIHGLGGRDTTVKLLEKVVTDLQKLSETGEGNFTSEYLGVRE
jgi:pyruvate ferredoxin oxidoreductase alpha subunit